MHLPHYFTSCLAIPSGFNLKLSARYLFFLSFFSLLSSFFFGSCASVRTPSYAHLGFSQFLWLFSGVPFWLV
ncbi:hypothetical protein EDC04DRAFT_1069925 [Pisolithus marmoratus]|nr:hypothetical protein EDC04DRAFT_1069925 [Pisolithus marmoratus]